MTSHNVAAADTSALSIPVPREYLNINAFFDYELRSQITGNQMDAAELARVFTPSMVEVELCRDRRIAIPEDVRRHYQGFRPTPLWRARGFEAAIDTSCEIYVKNEGMTPCRSHKANSALYIASLCKRDGLSVMTTETTGNWGLALAMAAEEFGLHLICFIDSESNSKRPDRKIQMEKLGAEVVVVENDAANKAGALALTAKAAVKYTQQTEGAAYVFGSIYGYFVVPQTVIGIEARAQLSALDREVDIVVGSCGGGANLLGTAGEFIAERLTGGPTVQIVSAESERCPILSSGKRGQHSIDDLGYYPMLDTYGLNSVQTGRYIGGLGSIVVSSAVAEFHCRGIIEAMVRTADHARSAVEMFHSAESMWVALESGYQLAAVIECARENDNKVILVNVSAGTRGNNLSVLPPKS